MSGWDMFVSRVLPKGEITGALAVVLRVKQEQIIIVKSIHDIEHVDKDWLVLCQTFLCKNHGFPLRIDVYLRHEQITYDETVVLGQLALLLQCNILVGDETLNPFSYWLYSHGNWRERVAIPTPLLDAQNMEEVDLEESPK